MENEHRGRASRASSTSSLGREVRCACQFYHSDSLLPERQALINQLPSRSMVQTPPLTKKPVKCSEHEYEPIAPAIKRILAPVIRISDTDVMPVADSDDSIDDPQRFHGAITLDGDLILPLDGTLEDSIMEGKELRHDGDTPEEEPTLHQYQIKIEQTFVQHDQQSNNQQPEPESHHQERVPKSLQKLRNQAGKLRKRLKGIHRPSFVLPNRQKSTKTTKITKTTKTINKSPTKKSSPVKTIEKPRETKKVSKLERLRMSLPDTSKFHLPDRSKFHIKKPNIHFPTFQKAPTLKEQQRQRSTESSYGSRKHIFDFSTMPKLFRGKDSNPSSKDSGSQAASAGQVSTLPKVKRSLSARWAHRFEETKPLEDDPPSAAERHRPWRHPSIEEPRLAFEIQRAIQESERLTWEANRKAEDDDLDEMKRKVDDEYKMSEDELEMKLVRQELKLRAIQDEIDPRLYGDQTVYEEDSERAEQESYELNFPPLDSRQFGPRGSSLAQSEEDGSVRSDREIQSSGSSSERRRHGVIEEIDSDEFFLREKGISVEDVDMGRYLANEIRDALRAAVENEAPIAPERVKRSKSMRSSKENSETPSRPKRERSLKRSQESFQSVGPKHRVVYRADSTGSRDKSPQPEPLDDIVVIKPVRRRSKTSLQSQGFDNHVTDLPPIVPARKRRPKTLNAPEKRFTSPAIDSNWPRIVNLQASSSEPAIQKGFEEDIPMMDEEDYIEPIPIVPKRRSRSRGTSQARDDDRTSHGAESWPEVSLEEEMPQDDESSNALPGYAVIEKKDKPPGVPPRTRRRRKFATCPRPAKKPFKTYSTVGPARPRTPITDTSLSMEIVIHSDHEMNQLSKIQGRPLPAPPRPPRGRRGRSAELDEVYASTQTDPLPDDMVIEEITQAKLIMTPSRSGSQIFISTERISAPTPPIPPLPSEERPASASAVESKTTVRERPVHVECPLERALRSNEPLKISSLEVANLRVDRLSVAQLEAYKIAASEIDAIVMSASEMSRKSDDEEEEKSLHPSLLRELLAIRSHLETVSENIQNQERAPSRQRTEDACTATSDERIDRLSGEKEEKDAASAGAASKQTRVLTAESGGNDEDECHQSAECRVLQVIPEPKKKEKRLQRQSASPVKSLPPVISVTPEPGPVGALRTDISDTRSKSQEHLMQKREVPRSRSSMPRDVFTAGPSSQEPGIADSFSQLLSVLRLSGARALHQLVKQVEHKVSADAPEEKVREVELALCALLLVVAALIVIYICMPHTVTHHHHWDFFNPPKG